MYLYMHACLYIHMYIYICINDIRLKHNLGQFVLPKAQSKLEAMPNGDRINNTRSVSSPSEHVRPFLRSEGTFERSKYQHLRTSCDMSMSILYIYVYNDIYIYRHLYFRTDYISNIIITNISICMYIYIYVVCSYIYIIQDIVAGQNVFHKKW